MRPVAFAFAASTLAMVSATASANPLNAFVTAVNGGSIEGCLAAFVPDAPVFDIGKNLTALERKQWFCKALVDAKSVYTILSEQRSGDTFTFTLDYRAGSYFLAGKGRVRFAGDKIAEMTIEAR